MTVRNLFMFNAIWSGLNALASILAPAASLDLYGLTADEGTTALVRIAGAGVVGYAAASWLMRDAGPSAARRAFLLGGGIGYIVVSLVSAYVALTVPPNAVIWVGVIVVLALGLVFLYFGRQPDAA